MVGREWEDSTEKLMHRCMKGESTERMDIRRVVHCIMDSFMKMYV